MKRMIATALLCALVALTATAQGGNLRALGLAGAMTAVNDDMNSLFYNPAGLAYVKGGHLDIEGMAGLDITRGMIGEVPVPDVWMPDGLGQTDYFYSLPGSGSGSSPSAPSWAAMVAILEANGIDAAQEALIARYDPKNDWSLMTEAEQFTAYQSYYAGYSQLKSLSNFGFAFAPRFVLGGPHWGLALVGDLGFAPIVSAFAGPDTSVAYWVDSQLGLVAGLGLDFGPFAFGGNLKVTRRYGYITDSSFFADLGGGPPLELLMQSALAAPEGSGELAIAAGLSALVSLGPLNAGIYVDNILPFLDPATKGQPFLEALLAGSTIGASFMPFDNKAGGFTLPFNLIASVDLKSFGSDTARSLATGVEAGINAWGFLQVLVRAGYSQPLPGSLFDIGSAFDPDLGQVSGGATLKLWFLKVELSATAPVSTIGTMAKSEFQQSGIVDSSPFGSVRLAVTAAF